MAYNIKSQKEAIVSNFSRLYNEIYVPVGELNMTAYHTPSGVPFSERTSGKKLELKPGDKWANTWESAWFHFTGQIPKTAAGKKVVLYIDIRGEICLVDENGVPVKGITSGSCFNVSEDVGCFGIRKREYIISECAKGGELIDIWGDACCSYLSSGNNSNRLPSGTVEFANICICRDNVKSLFFDFFILYDLMNILPEKSARCHKIRKALFDAVCVLYDYSDDEIEKAAAILKPVLEQKPGDPDLTLSAIGHSHLDLAWMWTIEEAKRKGVRIFANALYYMEQYPEYMFGASQPQLYQWIKELHPEMYAKIKERVKEGRWEVQGAMWCEPDANVTGGESFVRQILYGKRFFREEFGEESRILWLPDVFGYSAALPQILKKSGTPYFMTTKLGWGNRHNKHPHQTFIWKGIDGSKVLSHMPPSGSYNEFVMPRDIKKIEEEYEDKAVCSEALMLYGIGDGGGGPSDFHMENLRRTQNLSGIAPSKQSKAVDFFDRLAEHSDDYITFDGELYFEMHQGTYTTQGRNKRYNRKMEKLLREAEFAATAAGVEYPRKKLDDIWKEVLLYQFHDILPGSSIKSVYEESLARYAILCEETENLIRNAYGNGNYAINSLSWDRCGWEKIDGRWYNVNVPAMGSVMLTDGIKSNEVPVSDTSVLENDSVKVRFDESGAIISLFDKSNNREALTKPSNRFAVYFDNGDAWDMNEAYRDRLPKYFELTNVSAFTDGPVCGIVQEYRFSDSKLRQTISIKDGSAMVEFDTTVDWAEKGKLLRTAFYTSVESTETTCDIQFGYIKRTAHNNTSHDMAKFEICAHKYADLSEADYGVALLNDCKYGHCIKDGMIDLSLLRSAPYPSEESSGFRSDTGTHTFKYALYPHCGDIVHSDVIRKSYEFNQPLFTGNKLEQFFTVSNPDIIVEAVKKAEDSSSVIIRMYESKGGSCETSLNFNKPVKSAYIVDLMEENEQSVDLSSIKFHKFEIITIKAELC